MNEADVYSLWLTQALEKGRGGRVVSRGWDFQPDKGRTLFLSRLGDTIGHSSVVRGHV
jgi:hypothetical protein